MVLEIGSSAKRMQATILLHSEDRARDFRRHTVNPSPSMTIEYFWCEDLNNNNKTNNKDQKNAYPNTSPEIRC